MNNEEMNPKSNMIIYTTEDGLAKIETTFDEDTVWLSMDQMAELFQRDKSTISRHTSVSHKQAVDKATGEYIIEKCTDSRFLGVFGEKTVNVLKVNLMLDGIL